VQVAHGVDVQIDQAMAGDLIQHVVEETDAGVQLGGTRAIQIDAHGDLGFGGVACDLGHTVGAARGSGLVGSSHEAG